MNYRQLPLRHLSDDMETGKAASMEMQKVAMSQPLGDGEMTDSMFLQSEGFVLLAEFRKIADVEVRKSVLELVKKMASASKK